MPLAATYGVLALSCCAGAVAQEPAPAFDNARALAISQGAIGRQLGDYTLRDRTGRTVRLTAYRGKPLVVSLIYTGCYHTCPMTTQHLAKAVDAARAALGADSFNVATVGFEAGVDTPQAMAQFARQQRVRAEHWDFLSGDVATLARLVENVGFLYRASPKGYDHLIQATVIDAEGRVYAQVYGEVFETPWLIEPLKQLVFGTRPEDGMLAGMWNKVKLFCTTYDPASGKYRFDYSLFIGMAIGALIIGAGAAFLVRELRRARHA